MVKTVNTLSHAPQYAQHRVGVTTIDTLPESNHAKGVAADGFLAAHIQVMPSGGANPSVQVLVWSDELSQFIAPVEAEFTQAGAGADVPYEFTCAVRSRRFFVAVTAIAAGSVDICVAGSEQDHLR